MSVLKKLAMCFVLLLGMSTLSACVIDREHYHDREHHDRRDRDKHDRHDHRDHDHDSNYR